MAIDRQGMGLVIVRICIGVFFLSMGLNKLGLGWFGSTGPLTEQFTTWLDQAAPGSISRMYIERIAMPGLPYFARLVPIGEIVTGLALILGFWTRLFALVGFLMWLNFQIAGDTIMHVKFFINSYGLPIVGATLGLAIGGARLPWSIRL